VTSGESSLDDCSLWTVFGERWREPRYWSLLMQPFLLSPAINLGDICVALKRFPDLKPEAAIRRAHPFPILERFVGEHGARRPDGTFAVAPNTQASISNPTLGPRPEPYM
jgi:hypothetical protein